jgi:CBS domain containing-hemolysin-like protein
MSDGADVCKKRRIQLKSKLVRDLMVPLSDYATVSENATLGEAVAALKASQEGFDPGKHPHRAILILDKKHNVMGKISFLSILKALEPKYDQMLSDKGPWHLGFTRKFQKAMFESLRLWQDPMEQVCRKAAGIRVKTFMTAPVESEMIEINAPLGEAVHQLVIGHHQSLLVTEAGRVAGVLRLADVFQAVADAVLECKMS